MLSTAAVAHGAVHGTRNGYVSVNDLRGSWINYNDDFQVEEKIYKFMGILKKNNLSFRQHTHIYIYIYIYVCEKFFFSKMKYNK
jgi:hypothetical protein